MLEGILKGVLMLAMAVTADAQLAGTVYVAGDSTAAPSGTGNGTQGWAQYLPLHLSLSVYNLAIAGRSARSYNREGRFSKIASLLQPNDTVIIEFGHNDGTSSPDNGRSDCPGNGTEVCYYEYLGNNETVYTFPTYLKNATSHFLSLGASVIISSQTPNNPWETGTFVYAPTRFIGLAEYVAATEGVQFIDHNAYTYAAFQELGKEVVDGYFPFDHTHTSPEGAGVVAEAFVRGVVCGVGGLRGDVINGTADWEGTCL